MEFSGSHRNTTLTIPALDILVRYRYTGHVNIGQTGMGLETFFHADFQVLILSALSGAPGLRTLGFFQGFLFQG